MTSWKIFIIACIAIVYAEIPYRHQKREISSSICDPFQNNTNKVQCFCGTVSRAHFQIVSADCYQTVKNVSKDDVSWEAFTTLQNVSKLSLTNTKGIAMEYIPTNALKHTKAVLRLDIKYCNIETIESYAFANLSRVKEITLRDNQMRVLAPHAFAHHPSLKTLSLDQNNIAEINRDVFVDLPSLEKLFLTDNKISTIHDRAFIHLTNLKELEIDKNNIFSLNSETFSGLRNLNKLELSNNNLEVIGDNTFMPLVNLRSLNLAENKIQMLDEKAFIGLTNLQDLSLPSNKLTAIENEKVFEPLIGLNSLSLKDNKIHLIKPEALAPLLNVSHKPIPDIAFGGNHLPCDCSLDVFRQIINKTQNERIKLDIQNLQCYPSEEVKQKWDKSQENEKTNGPVFVEEEIQDNGAYEYYDDTELNGTLFYFDMRHLLNCSGEEISPTVPVSSSTPANTAARVQTTEKPAKAHSSPVTLISTNETPTERTNKISDRGTLDLSTAESTSDTAVIEENKFKSTSHNELQHENPTNSKEERKDKKDAYTTSRLATVSAKPLDQKGYDDHDMASDEAQPDRIKAHRSIQDEVKDSLKYEKSNGHRQFLVVPTHVLIILCFKIFL